MVSTFNGVVSSSIPTVGRLDPLHHVLVSLVQADRRSCRRSVACEQSASDWTQTLLTHAKHVERIRFEYLKILGIAVIFLVSLHLDLRDIAPRLADSLTINHLEDPRNLLSSLVERKSKHILVLVRARIAIRDHITMQERSALFSRCEVVKYGHLYPG